MPPHEASRLGPKPVPPLGVAGVPSGKTLTRRTPAGVHSYRVLPAPSGASGVRAPFAEKITCLESAEAPAYSTQKAWLGPANRGVVVVSAVYSPLPLSRR